MKHHSKNFRYYIVIKIYNIFGCLAVKAAAVFLLSIIIILFFTPVKLTASDYYPQGQVYKGYHPNYSYILIKAVENNNISMAVFALNKGANLKYRHPETGRYAYTIIANSDSQNIKSIFAGKTVNPALKRKFTNTELALISNENKLRSKNKNYIKTKKTKQKIIIPAKNDSIEKKMNVLYAAIEAEDIDSIKIIISENFDLNKSYNEQDPPLLYACSYGNPEIVNILIKNGANPDFRYPGYTSNERTYYFTPIGVTILYKNKYHHKILKQLLQNKADPNLRFDTETDTDMTALMLACLDGDETATKILLEYGADINATNDHSLTPIYYAITKDVVISTKMVRLCLDNGAKVNLPNPEGSISYMSALAIGNEETIKLLEKHNVKFSNDYNLQSKISIIAAKSGNLTLVKRLIDNKFNVNSKDDNNETMLYKASLYGHENVVNYLMDNGAVP